MHAVEWTEDLIDDDVNRRWRRRIINRCARACRRRRSANSARASEQNVTAASRPFVHALANRHRRYAVVAPLPITDSLGPEAAAAVTAAATGRRHASIGRLQWTLVMRARIKREARRRAGGKDEEEEAGGWAGGRAVWPRWRGRHSWSLGGGFDDGGPTTDRRARRSAASTATTMPGCGAARRPVTGRGRMSLAAGCSVGRVMHARRPTELRRREDAAATRTSWTRVTAHLLCCAGAAHNHANDVTALTWLLLLLLLLQNSLSSVYAYCYSVIRASKQVDLIGNIISQSV